MQPNPLRDYKEAMRMAISEVEAFLGTGYPNNRTKAQIEASALKRKKAIERRHRRKAHQKRMKGT